MAEIKFTAGKDNDKKVAKEVEKVEKAISEAKAKAARINADRKEASRLASLANKRVARLEKNNLKDSPAYQQYLKSGGKFSVRGKSYNEVQKELARLRRFIDSKSSTVKGVTSTLKEIANNTGISYKNLKDLKSKASKFFELSSKVEQYLRTVEDMASAIGYQKIWETINQYVKTGELSLEGSEGDIDSMVKVVSDAISQYDSKIKLPNNNWFTLKK